MKLIIAEKPSVAMAIAKVLGVSKRKDGYLEGENYIISWCLGHLVGLSQADKYKDEYKRWTYEDLPILPDIFKYEKFPRTKKQYGIVSSLMKRTDLSQVINACDSGREGELIFRLVYKQASCNKPIKRLWISSMEEGAIEEGFNNLRDGKDFENLYQSALARAQGDWIIGINGTRLFTVLYNQLLSVGRVQTPTLALLVKRGEEIINFKKEKHYYLDLNFKSFKSSSQKIKDKEKVEELKDRVINGKALVESIKREKKKQNPPLLYDLTSLQREANRKLSYTAKQSLDYLQSLYEKKWITYPRTDSRYLTEDMKTTVEKLVEDLNKDKLVIEANINRLIDNKKVSDHHGILPTRASLKMDKDTIPKGEQALYGLIVKRLLEAVSKAYYEEEIQVSFIIKDQIFTSKERKILDLGFKVFEKTKKEKIDIGMGNLKEGMELGVEKFQIREGFTQPPKHYTEDTLLAAMEKAGVEELNKDLEVENKGLGTPATRAGIIEKLISIDYIERKKKSLIATQKGISLITVIPEDLKSRKLTSDWENQLALIARGQGSREEFLRDIKTSIKDIVRDYSHVFDENKYRSMADKELIGVCPRCKSHIFEGKKNYYCSKKSCDFALFKEDRFFTKKKKKLSKIMAKELLDKGEIYVEGFYSPKKDKRYNAYVSIEDTGKYINYKMRF